MEILSCDSANGVGNLLERVLAMALKCGPENIDSSAAAPEISKLCEEAEKSYSQKTGNMQFHEALKDAMAFAGELDKYINNKKPWTLLEGDKAEAGKILGGLMFGLEKLVFWLKPYMPEKMERAEAYLKNPGARQEKLNLFPRIEKNAG